MSDDEQRAKGRALLAAAVNDPTKSPAFLLGLLQGLMRWSEDEMTVRLGVAVDNAVSAFIAEEKLKHDRAKTAH